METLIVGMFAAIIVGATAAFGYVVYADHSGRTARKRRLTTVRNWSTGKPHLTNGLQGPQAS